MNIKDAKILVVEDEEHINRLIELVLISDGYYKIRKAFDGMEALDLIKMDKPDLVLLDVMLPELDGFSLCKIIKEDNNFKSIQVIMLTAKKMEEDILKGFDNGAIDYISKPFSLREVIARVKAVLRRTVTTETERVPERLTYQSLVIDITKKKVSIDDEEVPLTKKEFEILLLLVQNKGRVFSREDILARIWSDEVYVLDRTIDVNITRLRKKIGVYGKCIVTRLGYGYCFEAE